MRSIVLTLHLLFELSIPTIILSSDGTQYLPIDHLPRSNTSVAREKESLGPNPNELSQSGAGLHASKAGDPRA